MRAREPGRAKKGGGPQGKPADSAGRPIPAATSARLGVFFGEAVDQVRIHDDASAAARAAAMGAHAFTEGDHVHFAEGRFVPGVRASEALLAHEVAHALQQRRGAGGRRDGAGAVEAEAHGAGFAFFRGEARAPGPGVGDGLALRRCDVKPAGRPPTEDEAKKLREYAFYRSLLEARRIDAVNAGQQQEVALKATLGTGDEASQRAVRNALDANRTAVQDRVAEIDRTKAAVEFEEKSLQDSLRYARPDEPIVWLDIPALGIGGWAPEHLAEMQKSMQAEPSYAAGVKDAKRYWAARSRGVGTGEAIAQIALVKAGEIVGVTQIAEALKGREVITGEELTGPERVMRAVVGVASLASFVSAAGPRAGGWGAGVKGGQVRLVQMAGPGGIVMAIGEGAAPLVLTAAEVRSLAVAGVGNLSLAMATTGGGGGGAGGPGDPEVDSDTAEVSQGPKDLRAMGPADNPSKGWGKGQIPCFPRGTLVSTPGGSRPIEELGPGDLVHALDLAAGVACAREVARRFEGETRAWVDVELEGGSLRATRRHPFWVESSGAWVEAAELAPGMRVRLRDGSMPAVARVALTPLEGSEPTFNLLVPGASTFFAGRLEVLVHNGGPAMDEAGHSNYILKNANGEAYYTGRFGPNETPASVKARHVNPTRSPGRFDEAAGDYMEVLPGTRTYGEARRLEHELTVRLKTFIGRVKGNYRGNRDYPMDARKFKDYYKPEACP